MKQIITNAIIFFWMIAPLGAQPASNFVYSLLNNQYLLESIRLTELAERYYDEGEYGNAIRYAEEALIYSQMSDNYVALQLRIKETEDALVLAQDRLNWAYSAGAQERYAEVYDEAQGLYGKARSYRLDEEWDAARTSAFRVIELLMAVKEIPSLPAQYLVRTWEALKDCLWNIAKKPQIYGDPLKWTVIYEANKAKLLNPNNPDLIHPGMILDIPSINGEIRKGLWDGESEIASTNVLR